jgi:hypothetical protein
MSEELACAGSSCLCHIDSETAVRSEGQLYCSQRCAEGRGCDHAGCNCGEFPAAEPEPDAITPQR